MAYAKDPFEEKAFEQKDKDIETALEQMVGGLEDDGLGDDEEPTIIEKEDDKKE
jgi:hypothetical protein